MQFLAQDACHSPAASVSCPVLPLPSMQLGPAAGEVCWVCFPVFLFWDTLHHPELGGGKGLINLWYLYSSAVNAPNSLLNVFYQPELLSHMWPQHCCLPQLMCSERRNEHVILVLCQPLIGYISLLLESQSLADQIYLFSLFWFMAYFSFFFFFLTSKLSLNDPEAVKWVCKLPQHLGIASQPLWNL